MPTREMSVWEGMRALRGYAGSEGTRSRSSAAARTIRTSSSSRAKSEPALGRQRAGWREPASATSASRAIGPSTAGQVKSQIADLTQGGATGCSSSTSAARRAARLDGGVAPGAAVRRPGGTLAYARDPRAASARRSLAAMPATGAITLPTAVLVDTGHVQRRPRVFAAALAGQPARRCSIGEHTIRAGRVRESSSSCPTAAGLWLATTRYLDPPGAPLHEKGLEADASPVDEPDVEFGQPAAHSRPGPRQGARADSAAKKPLRLATSE